MRYALAPLVEAAGMSEAELGRTVGLSGSSLTKARRDGLIESAADRYAVRAGLVPWLVWSDWLEDLSVSCEECAAMFVPARKSQRFCAPECQQRNQKRRWYRRRYQDDPTFRARENARSRAYQTEYAEHLNRQQSRRYREKREERIAYDRVYRERNKDHIKAKNRAYYLANRERIIARQAAYDRRKREQAA